MSKAGITETGAAETAAAFKFLTTEMGVRVKATNAKLAEDLADRLQAAGRREGRQARRLAKTVKVTHEGQEASVRLGEKQVFTKTKTNAFNVLFGSEFGALSGHGFRKWRKDKGYWILPTIEAPTVAKAQEDEWADMLDEALSDWSDY